MAKMYKKWNNNYKPYKKGSSISKRANGNFKAAKAQTDNAEIVVKGTEIVNAQYMNNLVLNNDLMNHAVIPKVGTAFVNFYEIIRNNKNFDIQKQLWDEFRINKIRVRLTVADAQININNYNQIKTIQVVTAWDRTGLSVRQVTAISKDNPDTALESDIINPVTEKRTKNVTHFWTKIGEVIEEYGSKFKAPMNSFQNFKRSCNLSVRDSAEKNCWFSTEIIDQPGFTYNPNNNMYTSDAKNKKTLEEFENDSNPTNPFENPTIKWKPTLLISVYNSGIVGNEIVKAADTSNVLFNMSYEVDVTFRGSRTIA